MGLRQNAKRFFLFVTVNRNGTLHNQELTSLVCWTKTTLSLNWAFVKRSSLIVAGGSISSKKAKIFLQPQLEYLQKVKGVRVMQRVKEGPQLKPLSLLSHQPLLSPQVDQRIEVTDTSYDCVIFRYSLQIC